MVLMSEQGRSIIMEESIKRDLAERQKTKSLLTGGKDGDAGAVRSHPH